MLCNIDQIRRAQEERILLSLKSWEEAKTLLKNAIALTETREREYNGICADVRSKLDALDLVAGLASGLENGLPEEKRGPAVEENRSIRVVPEAAPEKMGAASAVETSSGGFGGLVRRSSRPLFSNLQRSA